MKTSVLIALLCSSIALLSGCLTSVGAGEAVSEPNPPGFKTYTKAYSVKEGKLIFHETAWLDWDCKDTGLVLNTVIFPADTISYQLDGDSLKLFLWGSRTSESGLEVRFYDIYVRVGHGPGLRGRWLKVGRRYLIVSGEATEAEKVEFDDKISFDDRVRLFTDFYYLISADSISIFIDHKTAGLFIAAWNGLFLERPEEADSSVYDISPRLIDWDIVELKGLRTGETVRLRIGKDLNRDFSSDATGHAPFHYEDPPVSCPTEYEPAWYREFLEANRNLTNPEDGLGLEKRAENRPKTGYSRHFPFAPLKTIASLLN